MAINILKPGLATTVQDLGRPGYYHLGIPLSGALDQGSLRLGNLIVGNDEGAAALECTLMAPEIAFERDLVFAVTGATAEARLNGQAVPPYTALQAREGDRLGFSFMTLGARIYLCVAGGVDVPVVLGSRSTYALGAFGGHQGRKLVAGDRLAVGQPAQPPVVGRALPQPLWPQWSKQVELRVLSGLYDHRLAPQGKAGFYRDSWAVAPEADRIGYRYKGGQRLQFIERQQPFGAGSDPSNIVDAGYPYGSIQVPSGAEPIILHRDAVSGGGYAMIGTVISADMDLIAQAQPGHRARFVEVSLSEALSARQHRRARLQELRAALDR